MDLYFVHIFLVFLYFCWAVGAQMRILREAVEERFHILRLTV